MKIRILFLSLTILSVVGCSASKSSNCDELKSLASNLANVLVTLQNNPSNESNLELAKIIKQIDGLNSPDKSTELNSLKINIKNLMTALNGQDLSSAADAVNAMTTDIQQLTVACNA